MSDTSEIREGHKLDLAAEVLRAGGAIRVQALGTSMLPSIWPGDVLGIEDRTDEEIVPGDILLVARDRRFFIHRLIEKCGSQWITRGDSLPQNDAPVAGSQVLGKVCAIHRRTGVVVPSPRVSLFVRMLAWMLCRWDPFRNVALHIHSVWQERPFTFFFRKAGLCIPRNASTTRTFDTNDAYLSDCGE
jgi:hypothetical protein